MEHVCECSKPKKRRVYWSKEVVVKTFLETCIHEIALTGREASSLKPASWRNLAETLKKKHNFIVNQRQMKNHYDYLKGKYGAWIKLKNRRGDAYDPSTNTFNLSDEEWQIEMKSNKYVQRLRSAPLPFPELCVQLFDGLSFTEDENCVPISSFPNPSPVASNLIEASPITTKLIEDSPVSPKLIEDSSIVPKLIEDSPDAPKLIEDSPVAPKLIEDTPVDSKLIEDSTTGPKVVEDSTTGPKVVEDSHPLLVEDSLAAPKSIEDLEVKDTQESCGSTRKRSPCSQTPIKKRKGAEHVCESSQAKKRRAYWSKEVVVKTFLETCIHEIALNGWVAGSLKPDSWKNVAETLKKTHNFIVNQKQMKNYYDYLKGKYRAWSKLKNKRGNVYDPLTNTFNLSEEEWQIEMESIKYLQRVRSTPLPFPELCVQLFDRTKVGSSAPTSTLPNPSPVAPDSIEDSSIDPKMIEDSPVPLRVIDDSHIAPKLIEDSPVAPEPIEDSPVPPKPMEDSPVPLKLIKDSPVAPKLIEDSPVAPKLIKDSHPKLVKESPAAPRATEDLEVKDTQESCGSTRKGSPRSQTPIKKRKGKQPSNSVIGEDFVKAVKHVLDKQKGDDMAACIDKLDNLGWETNPCYDVALFLFSESADYRKLWLLLKDERCENWVKMMGRKHKLF